MVSSNEQLPAPAPQLVDVHVAPVHGHLRQIVGELNQVFQGARNHNQQNQNQNEELFHAVLERFRQLRGQQPGGRGM